MSEQPEWGFDDISLGKPIAETPDINSRHIQYWLVAIGLILISLPLHDSHWISSIQLHSLMEVVCTILALFIGVMAIIRYYTRTELIYLMVGAGFLGTFFLDGYHMVVTSSYFQPFMPSNLPALIPWSWIASRQFLSIFLFLSWLLWKNNYQPKGGHRHFERLVFICAALFMLAVSCFFIFSPLPPAYSPHVFFHRPAEFFPFLFFSLALWGYLSKGHWRSDTFEHWLVISLIISLFGQAVYMSVSAQVFDLEFDVAHLLKIASYICVLIGLMSSMFEVFKREQKSGQILATAVRNAKESERDAIVENIHHGVTLYNKQFKLLVCNHLFIDLMALPDNAAKPGVDINQLFHRAVEDSEDSDHHSEQYQNDEVQLTRIKAFSSISYRRILTNEQVIEIVGTPVPMGYVLTYTDITEQVSAQQQALKTSEKLIEIFETSPVGIGITLAADDSIRWINSCGAKLLGFNECDEVIGYSALNCWTSPEQRTTFIKAFEQSGSVKAREVQLKNSQGKPFWCYLSWYAIEFEGQDCILYWMYDITLKKEVQRQLFDSEKLASLGRLVAGVAHEINTPIGVGITATTYMQHKTEAFLEGLESGTLSKKGLHEYLKSTAEGLDITFNNLKSAANLVESFKQVSVDRISEKPRVIGLHRYFKDIIQSLHPKIKKAAVSLDLKCDQDCSFHTYPGALSQIIANLISNSIIHGFESQANGMININLKGVEGKEIQIEYQDNGIGIPSDIVYKVMDPFFTTKRQNGGTGLGLSIVHNIVVDKLHGTIKLTSHLGEGIRILIAIPSLSVKPE